MLKKSHELFCLEYIKDSNATRAYKVAYPDCKADGAARTNSAKLLANANIMRKIDELSCKVQSKAENEIIDIITELKRVAYFDIAKVLSWEGDFLVVKSFDEVPEEARRVIAEIKQMPATKESSGSLHIKFHDKLKALDSLARYHGIFKDKLDVTHNMTIEQIVQKAKTKDNQDGTTKKED